MADKLEQLIKQYLESRSNDRLERRENVNYPASIDLYRYLNDELEGAELERLLAFLKKNEEWQALVSRARQILSEEEGWKNENVPPDMIRKAQALMGSKTKSASCPHCGKPITPFKTPLSSQQWMNRAWLALTLGSLALSFVIHRYFIQCLVVTALAGMKCIVEMRATKTQILIYKALTATDGPEHHRLHHETSRL